MCPCLSIFPHFCWWWRAPMRTICSEGTTLRGNGPKLGRFREISVKMSSLEQWSSPGTGGPVSQRRVDVALGTQLSAKCWTSAWRAFPSLTILWFFNQMRQEERGPGQDLSKVTPGSHHPDTLWPPSSSHTQGAYFILSNTLQGVGFISKHQLYKQHMTSGLILP